MFKPSLSNATLMMLWL